MKLLADLQARPVWYEGEMARLMGFCVGLTRPGTFPTVLGRPKATLSSRGGEVDNGLIQLHLEKRRSPSDCSSGPLRVSGIVW